MDHITEDPRGPIQFGVQHSEGRGGVKIDRGQGDVKGRCSSGRRLEGVERNWDYSEGESEM